MINDWGSTNEDYHLEDRRKWACRCAVYPPDVSIFGSNLLIFDYYNYTIDINDAHVRARNFKSREIVSIFRYVTKNKSEAALLKSRALWPWRRYAGQYL